MIFILSYFAFAPFCNACAHTKKRRGKAWGRGYICSFYYFRYTSQVFNFFLNSSNAGSKDYLLRTPLWKVLITNTAIWLGLPNSCLWPRNVVVFHQTLLPRRGVGSGHETILRARALASIPEKLKVWLNRERACNAVVSQATSFNSIAAGTAARCSCVSSLIFLNLYPNVSLIEATIIILFSFITFSNKYLHISATKPIHFN